MRALLRLLFAASVAAASPDVLAQPVIIEPSATIENPDPVSWPSFEGVTAGNLRSSGSVQLWLMRAGAITELARAPLAVTVGRNYRLRLESMAYKAAAHDDKYLAYQP